METSLHDITIDPRYSLDLTIKFLQGHPPRLETKVGIRGWTNCRFQRGSLPELHAVMIYRGKDWPENTTFAYFWQTIVDRVISLIEGRVLEKSSLAHCSLHFDGLMVQDDSLLNVPEFMADLEQHVFGATGFSINLTEKLHLSWLELVLHEGPVDENSVRVSPRDEAFWFQPQRTVSWDLLKCVCVVLKAVFV